MLSGGMLASSLTLLLSLLVLVLSCRFLSGFAAWLWLLSLVPCPPGVLGITLVDLCSLGEDMRSMYAFCSGAFCEFLPICWPPAFLVFCSVFIPCMPFLVSFSFCVYVALWATSIERHLFFVIRNSFQYYIV